MFTLVIFLAGCSNGVVADFGYIFNYLNSKGFIYTILFMCFQYKEQASPIWCHCPVGICLLKVSNRNTRTRCETCSKSKIKITERHHWRRSSVLIVNFEHVNADWVVSFYTSRKHQNSSVLFSVFENYRKRPVVWNGSMIVIK